MVQEKVERENTWRHRAKTGKSYAKAERLCPSRFEVLIFLLVQSTGTTLHHLEVPNSSQK
ncbi:MAG: hypothetical protein RM347_030545 [Nostoc sp. ChiQUE02]|uniref:hypothetical protein n=1 Tax=Nostoc sp. ChiQUE02 TaxID=3075377 RepID=UPI002AD57B86|nr:hypothetical protein [Nostoc sp. ChiQUE02]MDZ8234846.1 hypothetical protein [Nostoc sp. ChiQUE02]